MTNKEYYSDYKWIKVKKYQMDKFKSWESKYKDLEAHHVDETTFLINEVRSLADKLDAYEEKALAEIAEATKLQNKHKEKAAKLQKRQDRDDAIRTFLVMWFGFAITLILIVDSFIDKQTQFLYSNWILSSTMLLGFVMSCLFTYHKWKQDHANPK